MALVFFFIWLNVWKFLAYVTNLSLRPIEIVSLVPRLTISSLCTYPLLILHKDLYGCWHQTSLKSSLCPIELCFYRTNFSPFWNYSHMPINYTTLQLFGPFSYFHFLQFWHNFLHSYFFVITSISLQCIIDLVPNYCLCIYMQFLYSSTIFVFLYGF